MLQRRIPWFPEVYIDIIFSLDSSSTSIVIELWWKWLKLCKEPRPFILLCNKWVNQIGVFRQTVAIDWISCLSREQRWASGSIHSVATVGGICALHRGLFTLMFEICRKARLKHGSKENARKRAINVWRSIIWILANTKITVEKREVESYDDRL